MNRDVPHRADRLDFLPQQFARWLERSHANDAQSYAWYNYTLLLVSFAEAFSRAPMTEDACNTLDIIEHLTHELNYLSSTIQRIIPESEGESSS